MSARMMICDSCHKQVAAGLFCLKCGAKQSEQLRHVDSEVHTPVQDTDSDIDKHNRFRSRTESVTQQASTTALTRQTSAPTATPESEYTVVIGPGVGNVGVGNGARSTATSAAEMMTKEAKKVIEKR